MRSSTSPTIPTTGSGSIPGDVDGLTAWLAEVPDARRANSPFAGVERGGGRPGCSTTPSTWMCAKGAYAEPVLEYALALALAGLRHLPALVDRPGRGGSRPEPASTTRR